MATKSWSATRTESFLLLSLKISKASGCFPFASAIFTPRKVVSATGFELALLAESGAAVVAGPASVDVVGCAGEACCASAEDPRMADSPNRQNVNLAKNFIDLLRFSVKSQACGISEFGPCAATSRSEFAF